MNNRLNKYKYPGAKRLMLEALELKDKTEDYCAQPIDDNLFEWHFTVRGPPETAFEGGYYHGRLSFPTDYPMKPPSIILLTPNGRFETNKKICLSISGHHPETWQPSWSVRTALLALVAFMPTKANRAIGSLDFSDAERKKLARNSRTWRCETCGPIKDLLLKQAEDVRNGSACQASTSRVSRDDCSHIHERPDVKSLSSDRTDSDGEARDSSTDSQGGSVSTSSTTNGSDSDEPSCSTLATTSKSRRESAKIESNISATASGSSNQEDQTSASRATSHQKPPPSLAERSSSDFDAAPHPPSSSGASGNRTIAADEGRSYPPLVFISISILLFLLILRRVVMMIQA